jgi:ABC-type transport system involved in multi-copper enzyme maturation permease subunit
MIMCTVVLLFITFGFPLFGIRNIIPSRWFAFMYFFLSIMAAFALLSILSKTSKKGLGLMMCFVILSSLTFFMTTSTISNEDSCFWLRETTISAAYTAQEGIGAETLSNVAERVLVDSRYAEVISNMPHNAEGISFSSDRQITSTPDTVFLWRQYMLDRPVRTSMHLEGYYKNLENPNVLGIEILNKLDQFNKMYDNHGVQGYYLTGTRIV